MCGEGEQRKEDKPRPVYLMHDTSAVAQVATVGCWKCSKSMLMSEAIIDTSGPAYQAYYCAQCAPGPWPVVCDDLHCTMEHPGGRVCDKDASTIEMIEAALKVATAGFHLDHSVQSRKLLGMVGFLLDLVERIYPGVFDDDKVDLVNKYMDDMLVDLVNLIDLYMPKGFTFGVKTDQGLGFWYDGSDS